MISAVVLTKNEKENIERCLKSLNWCDEVLVVDDNSEDETRQIAENLGAKVVARSLEGDFSNQRNFALRKAAGEWVFFVDADEEVPEALQQEIIKFIKDIKFIKEINGFYLRRKDFFLGKWLRFGETSRVRLLRLARKGAGEWERAVDEIWKVRGRKKNLKTPLLHSPHPNLDQFLKSINERSTFNARVFYDKNVRVKLLEWTKPILKFISNYFLRLGFLDGAQGFLIALLMSFHSFLVRGKLYLLWKKERGWR